ncbi:class I SAM-dependent methyltransferase [Novosphingobium album (ex Liu et al. 2023)]|uniref:Methyltransferase domain-containing protein n=1 Tax=Novosphingobium album (ex Liu et al. 2023) TaxID=3031130 RepID=A0ABT5WQB3_9SPHN|nr:methyltransferase domain-containing protein [Novosphingobium album (ex Liu et al. 2023)]MDE8652200.1 methyltransferase domain-containing protein [Novosphingobium album (ex Liu et al. 2023)]
MTNFVTRGSCPVCGDATATTIYRSRHDIDPLRALIESQYRDQGSIDWVFLQDEEFAAAKCHSCGLIFQERVPDETLLGQVYETMIAPERLAAFEDGLMTIESVEKIAGELGHLFRLTGKNPADITFLDYGFGHGRWARVARGMGAKVFGVELGDDKARLAASLGIELIDDDALEREAFDIVHTEQVLEHLVHPGRDFARLARATRRLLKVAVPVRGNLEQLLSQSRIPSVSAFALATRGARVTRADRAFSSLQPLEHLNAYSPRTIQWLANANGLKIASRTRLGSVSVDITSPTLLMASAKRLATMMANGLLRPDRGYYLLTKGRGSSS